MERQQRRVGSGVWVGLGVIRGAEAPAYDYPICASDLALLSWLQVDVEGDELECLLGVGAAQWPWIQQVRQHAAASEGAWHLSEWLRP